MQPERWSDDVHHERWSDHESTDEKNHTETNHLSPRPSPQLHLAQHIVLVEQSQTVLEQLGWKISHAEPNMPVEPQESTRPL